MEANFVELFERIYFSPVNPSFHDCLKVLEYLW